jgi:hypothetical protein
VVNISAPLNALFMRILVTNESYYGEVIREPGDPWLRQAWDALKFAASEGYTPFIGQTIQRGGGTADSFMGVGYAPVGFQRTDLENYLHDIAPPPYMTHEEAARAQARRDLSAALKAHDPEKARTAIQAGGLSGRSVQATERAGGLTPLQRQFEYATLPQAVHGYEIATPEERSQIRPYLLRKASTGLGTIPADERLALVTRIKAALALPTVTPLQVGAR